MAALSEWSQGAFGLALFLVVMIGLMKALKRMMFGGKKGSQNGQ